MLIYPGIEKNGKGFSVKGVSLWKRPPMLALWVSLFLRFAPGRGPLWTNDGRCFVGKSLGKSLLHKPRRHSRIVRMRSPVIAIRIRPELRCRLVHLHHFVGKMGVTRQHWGCRQNIIGFLSAQSSQAMVFGFGKIQQALHGERIRKYFHGYLGIFYRCFLKEFLVVIPEIPIFCGLY